MRAILIVACLFVCGWGASVAAEEASAWSTEFHWGGAGGVYLLAAPGDLWLEVEKCDLNRTGRPTHLRAILFGPDREVLDEQILPDDGKAKGSGSGPVQRARLSTTASRKGVYGLSITISNDRYGEDVAWAFRTNCPQYLVETSRGHRDAPHEEPFVLLSPSEAGDVCFAPPRRTFSIEVSELPPGTGPLTLFDAEDKPAGELAVSEKGDATGRFEVPSNAPGLPWRLHLPKFKGIVHIDGVTRWTDEDVPANLSLWTPHRESWFPLAAHRWVLLPYHRVVYADPGDEGSVGFQVRNDADTAIRIALAVEAPDGPALPAELSAHEVAAPPHQAVEVSLKYRVPPEGERWLVHLRATPTAEAEFTTYSTLEVRRGTAPASRPLDLPLVLRPYRHENEQLGYTPDYPVGNQMYFDTGNRPVSALEDSVALRRDNGWTRLPFPKDAAGNVFHIASTKVAFDRDNGMYLLGEAGGATALLHARDAGEEFRAIAVPGAGHCDIEQFSGHNLPEGPPPFVRFTLTEKDPKLIWRRLNDLALFLPKKEGGDGLSIPDPVLISKKCIGYSGHSGMPSSLVSRASRVHVVWAEATEPEEKAPGVPTFAATYDRETGTLSAPALIGYGPPANDVHNTPCITMDSQGYLHVLIGTHGRTFKYARSLAPNSAGGGWTEAEDLGPGLRQTYVGMVCGPDDTLHVVFRLWNNDTQYFPAGDYACLAYMNKRPGQPWSAPRPLVVPPFSEYSVFYHRLTIDRAGRLFLSYDYWSTYWFYRTDHWGSRRALLMSPDQGATWKLAEETDFLRKTQALRKDQFAVGLLR